jgi:MscS family membrane protein
VNWGNYQAVITQPLIQAALIVAGGYLVSLLVDQVGFRMMSRITAHTDTKFDDDIVAALRMPIRRTIVLVALWFAISLTDILPQLRFVINGIVATWALSIWTQTSFGLTELVVTWLSNIEGRFTAVTKSTSPAWKMAAHLLSVSVAAYFFFLCWDFDVTGWLASAGIIGVAVGFGAKDTMANLFAGIGILADQTYKLGDFLLLDTGERGRVTDIGLRSTRLLTLDEMEIIVPNSAMATAKIINESGGPRECERIAIDVSIAYGSDVDQVREMLLGVAMDTEGVLKNDPNRKPAVHFVAMGDSALEFKLLCFIGLPEHRPDVIDRLNSGVYKMLTEANIEIPFPQRTIHMAQDTQTEQ